MASPSSLVTSACIMTTPWTQPLPEWWISWPLSIWPRLSVSPLTTKATTGCCMHLTTTSVWYHRLWPHLHHLPPQHRRSSLPAYIHHDMKYLHHRPCCPESRPVHMSLLAPALMTGLCADWRPWWPCSWLCAAESTRRRKRPCLAVLQRRSGFESNRDTVQRDCGCWRQDWQFISNVKKTCNQTSSQRQNYLLLE